MKASVRDLKKRSSLTTMLYFLSSTLSLHFNPLSSCWRLLSDNWRRFLNLIGR